MKQDRESKGQQNRSSHCGRSRRGAFLSRYGAAKRGAKLSKWRALRARLGKKSMETNPCCKKDKYRSCLFEGCAFGVMLANMYWMLVCARDVWNVAVQCEIFVRSHTVWISTLILHSSVVFALLAAAALLYVHLVMLLVGAWIRTDSAADAFCHTIGCIMDLGSDVAILTVWCLNVTARLLQTRALIRTACMKLQSCAVCFPPIHSHAKFECRPSVPFANESTRCLQSFGVTFFNEILRRRLHCIEIWSGLSAETLPDICP